MILQLRRLLLLLPPLSFGVRVSDLSLSAFFFLFFFLKNLIYTLLLWEIKDKVNNRKICLCYKSCNYIGFNRVL